MDSLVLCFWGLTRNAAGRQTDTAALGVETSTGRAGVVSLVSAATNITGQSLVVADANNEFPDDPWGLATVVPLCLHGTCQSAHRMGRDARSQSRAGGKGSRQGSMAGRCAAGKRRTAVPRSVVKRGCVESSNGKLDKSGPCSESMAAAAAYDHHRASDVTGRHPSVARPLRLDRRRQHPVEIEDARLRLRWKLAEAEHTEARQTRGLRPTEPALQVPAFKADRVLLLGALERAPALGGRRDRPQLVEGDAQDLQPKLVLLQGGVGAQRLSSRPSWRMACTCIGVTPESRPSPRSTPGRNYQYGAGADS